MQQAKSQVLTTLPVKAFWGSLILTMVLFVGLGLWLWSSHEIAETLYNQEFRLQELCGRIVHLDEVLTMSAWMAAISGDTHWEQRYNKYEPQIDASIKELEELASGDYKIEGAIQTDEANVKLVEIEKRAFDLVRQGDREGALALLSKD